MSLCEHAGEPRISIVSTPAVAVRCQHKNGDDDEDDDEEEEDGDYDGDDDSNDVCR